MNRIDYKLIIKIYLCFITYYLLSVFVIEKYIYKFILWNLFLAMLPVGFAFLLQMSVTMKPKIKIQNYLLGVLWLIFFPNAPYLITDLVHMNAMPFYEVGIRTVGIEYWVSLLHIGGGVIFGLLAGMYSLKLIHQMIIRKTGTAIGHIMLAGICLLTGYGIYIGRFIRLNTWDILNPAYVIDAVIGHINKRGLILSLLFATFTLFCYLLFYMFTNPGRSK